MLTFEEIERSSFTRRGLNVALSRFCRVFFFFFCPNMCLTCKELNTEFRNVYSDFLLYEGVICAIMSYQKKLCLKVKENLVI